MAASNACGNRCSTFCEVTCASPPPPMRLLRQLESTPQLPMAGVRSAPSGAWGAAQAPCQLAAARIYPPPAVMYVRAQGEGGIDLWQHHTLTPSSPMLTAGVPLQRVKGPQRRQRHRIPASRAVPWRPASSSSPPRDRAALDNQRSLSPPASIDAGVQSVPHGKQGAWVQGRWVALLSNRFLTGSRSRSPSPPPSGQASRLRSSRSPLPQGWVGRSGGGASLQLPLGSASELAPRMSKVAVHELHSGMQRRPLRPLRAYRASSGSPVSMPRAASTSSSSGALPQLSAYSLAQTHRSIVDTPGRSPSSSGLLRSSSAQSVHSSTAAPLRSSSAQSVHSSTAAPLRSSSARSDHSSLAAPPGPRNHFGITPVLLGGFQRGSCTRAHSVFSSSGQPNIGPQWTKQSRGAAPLVRPIRLGSWCFAQTARPQRMDARAETTSRGLGSTRQPSTPPPRARAAVAGAGGISEAWGLPPPLAGASGPHDDATCCAASSGQGSIDTATVGSAATAAPEEQLEGRWEKERQDQLSAIGATRAPLADLVYNPTPEPGPGSEPKTPPVAANGDRSFLTPVAGRSTSGNDQSPGARTPDVGLQHSYVIHRLSWHEASPEFEASPRSEHTDSMRLPQTWAAWHEGSPNALPESNLDPLIGPARAG